MKLLLLRHADAEAFAESDEARPLSEKGRLQALEVARLLQNYTVRPKLILTSPATRTRETAAPIASLLGVESIPCPWARCGMPPEEAMLELAGYAPFGKVLLVGHQPDLGMLASRLIGLPQPARFHVGKATLVHLNLTTTSSALLEALIPCHLQ